MSEDTENGLKTLGYLHNRIVKYLLMPMGGWPNEVFHGKTPLVIRFLRKYVAVQGFCVILGQINYIVQNYERLNFFLLGHIYITMFLAGITLVRSILLNQEAYIDTIKFFYWEFDLEHFKHKGPYYKKASETVYKVSYYYSQAIAVIMVCGMCLYNMLPMYHNYKSGVFHSRNRNENATIEFSVYYQPYPGFKPENHFWILTFENIFLSYICSVNVCIVDLLMSLFVFHMIGHIMILLDNIKNIKLPKHHHHIQGFELELTVELYDDAENEVISGNIIEFVNHHRFIVSFANDVSSLLGPTLASTYLCHLISCCLLLLECSQLDPDALAQYGPLTVIIFFQLFQISVLFEILGATSEKLIDAVYEIPWQCMDVRNQRSLCFFLQRVQSPVQVTALGMTEVGVKPMVAILKTTFSLFTFLRSIV